MKNTFSAYVRLSQTRTRESMQAAFRGFRAQRSGPVPGQGDWRDTKPPPAKGGTCGGVGAIIRLARGHACNARVTEFPIMKPRRPGPLLYQENKCVLVVPPGCSEGARGDVYGRWCGPAAGRQRPAHRLSREP